MGLKQRVSRLERTTSEAGEGCVRCAGDADFKMWLKCAGEPQPPMRTCPRCGREITIMLIINLLADGARPVEHADG